MKNNQLEKKQVENVEVTYKKIQVKGLKERYTFLHITDSHLSNFGPAETAERAEYGKWRVEMFSKDGIVSEERFRTYVDFANQENVSAVLLTGDIVDFPSPENMTALKNMLAELKMPYIYALGNHDWSYFNDVFEEDANVQRRQQFRSLCGGDEDFHIKTIGELTFVVLDNTTNMYRPNTENRLREAVEQYNNIIILQHIPLYCETLHEDTVEYWKADLNLGGKGTVLDDSADNVLKILTASPTVKAIICGHLHFAHEDLLDGILPQYVTALSSYGAVTLFEISGS